MRKGQYFGLMINLLITTLINLQRNGKVEAFEYNESISKYIGALSMVSYCNPQNIQNWDCGDPCNLYPNLSDINYLSNKSNYAFVGYGNDSIFIIFRGTILKNKDNWIDNIQFVLREFHACEGCQVHNGFLKSYKRLQHNLLDIVENYYFKKYPNASLILGGHSLGGVLATIAAADIYSKFNKKIDTLITLGSPRIGNNIFKKWFENTVKPTQMFRITYSSDPIPYLIPEKVLWLINTDYKHIGKQIHYKKDNKFTICSGQCSREWNREILFAHVHYFGWDWKQLRKDEKCHFKYHPSEIISSKFSLIDQERDEL